MWEALIDTFSSYDYLDWIALVSGIIYVVLAARANVLCWFFGIIQCAIFAYKDFTSYQLYADGYLQIFYIAMAVWGIVSWMLKKENSGEIRLSNRLLHIIVIPLILLIGYFLLPMYYNFYPDANFPLLDTITTLFSVFATYLLVQRDWTNWIYWIIIDFVYVFLYFKTGADAFAILYFIYGLVAIYGLYQWRLKV